MSTLEENKSPKLPQTDICGATPTAPLKLSFSATLATLVLPNVIGSAHEGLISARDDDRGKLPPEKDPKAPEKNPEVTLQFQPVVVDVAGKGDEHGKLSRFTIQLHPSLDSCRQYVLFTNPDKGVITSVKLEKPISEVNSSDPKGEPIVKVNFTSFCGKTACDKGYILYDKKGNASDVVFTTDNEIELKKPASRAVLKLDNETAKEVVQDIDKTLAKFAKDNPKHEVLGVFAVSDGAAVPDAYIVSKDNSGEKHLYRLRDRVRELPIKKETATGPGNASLILEAEGVIFVIRDPAMTLAESKVGTVTTARGTKPLIDLLELIAEQKKK